MDLAVGARRVIIMLEHTDSRGRPKLVERCEFPLTAPRCVDTVVTDLALLTREDEHLGDACEPSIRHGGDACEPSIRHVGDAREPSIRRFRLDEVARGFTVDEVLSLTGMSVRVADTVGIMQDNW